MQIAFELPEVQAVCCTVLDLCVRTQTRGFHAIGKRLSPDAWSSQMGKSGFAISIAQRRDYLHK